MVVFVTLEWAFVIYRGSGSSPTESAMLQQITQNCCHITLLPICWAIIFIIHFSSTSPRTLGITFILYAFKNLMTSCVHQIWAGYITDASMSMKAVLMILQRTWQGSVTGWLSEVGSCSYNCFDRIDLKGATRAMQSYLVLILYICDVFVFHFH